jgi:hypothetical protein
MAGQLTVDTLKASSGVLATQNGMTGIAKAWVYYNGSTNTVNNSFNVTGVTRTATGKFYVTFTNAMPNANYAVAGAIATTTGGGASTTWMTDDVNNPRTTTNLYWWTISGNGLSFDNNPNINIVILGN